MTRSTPRRLRAALAGLLVLALHVWLAVALDRASRPGDRFAGETSPARLQVQFVAELRPQWPQPPALPSPRAIVPRLARLDVPAVTLQAVEPAASPASAPPAGADHAPANGPELSNPEGSPDPGSAAAAVPTVADMDGAGPTPAVSGFDWPPSTRLRYALTGYYRGPVEGSAEVQWLREGSRYQVHLDVVIGAPFAPLITRHMRSDGRLTAEGLAPQRYEETTQWLFGAPQRQRIRFEPDTVRLADGRRAPRPPGLQDAVSQFVHLAWRFTTDPALLQPGQVVTVPLALPRRVEHWVYDVQAPETLSTPDGPLQALRLRPRRAPRPGGDLVPEAWYAPALMNLPVRMHIRQGAETWVDLVMDRWPLQAAAPPPPARTPPPPPSPPGPAMDPGSIGGN